MYQGRSRHLSILTALLLFVGLTISNATEASAAVNPNPITISVYTGDHQAFNPATSGVSGGYCLSDAANVTTTVTAVSSGSVVRTLETGVSHPADCNYSGWSWDGTDDQGATVPDGFYNVAVTRWMRTAPPATSRSTCKW